MKEGRTVDFSHINKLQRILGYEDDERTGHWQSNSGRKLFTLRAEWTIAAMRILELPVSPRTEPITIAGEITKEPGMKIYQAIAIFDYYVVAENSDDARDTLRKWINGYDGAETPIDVNELTAREVREEREIRKAMCEIKPLVGATVTDDDFEKIVKGNTNLTVLKKLHTKTAK